MEELTNYLLDGKHRTELSADSLELMGKRAANMYLDFKVPLNEGIAKIASEHKDINPEQVKRVVEFANIAVYLSEHDHNKTAGADTSYPQFELADSTVIIQSLGEETKTVTSSAVNVDYASQPRRKEKTSSIETDKLFSQMFGTDNATKLASAESNVESAAGELVNAKHSAEDLRDSLSRSYDQIDNLYKMASEEYYELVKRYMLDDGDFSHVMVAARSTDLSDEKIAYVIKPVVEKLLEEKVASSKQLNQSIRNLEKVAFRVINPEHPLVTTFSGLVLLDEEKRASWLALKDATDQHEKIAKVIKETFLVKASK